MMRLSDWLVSAAQTLGSSRRTQRRSKKNGPQQSETLEDRCLLAVVNAVQSGNWSSPSTWGGSLPTAADDVFIESQHNVTYDMPEDGNSAAEAKTITIRHGGKLTFSRSVSTRLDLGGSLMVLMNGTLDAGTPNDPIPAGVTTTIGFNVANDRLFKGNTEPGPWEGMPDFHPDDYGLWTMMAGATSTFHGAEKNFTWTKLGEQASAGDTTIELTQAPSGWRVGDQILITPTQDDPDETEIRTITAISGKILTLNEPLDHFHESRLHAYDPATGTTRAILNESDVHGDEMLLPIRAEVGLLTHNVTVQSNLVTEGDQHHRSHTAWMMGGGGSIGFTEFRNLGPRAKMGRYPVHFHKMGDTNGFEVSGASIWNSISDPGNKFLVVHDTGGVVVEDTIGFNAQGAGFLLEDAEEVGNTFDHNLATRVHGPEELPGSAGVEFNYDGEASAAFWVREGNTFTNNVAAGNVTGAVGLWTTPTLVDTSEHPSLFTGNESRSNHIGARHSGTGESTEVTFGDTLIGINGVGCIMDTGVTLNINDSLLYGNGINNQGDGAGNPDNSYFVDYVRVPTIEIPVDQNPEWTSDASYTLTYTLVDGLLRTEIEEEFQLDEGLNVITAIQYSADGEQLFRDWNVVLDTQAPTITVDSNRNPAVTNSDEYLLKYTVHDDGKELFKHAFFTLQQGSNTLYVTTRDLAGNVASASYQVTYDPNHDDGEQQEGNVTFTDGSEADSDVVAGEFYVNPTVNAFDGSKRPELRVVSGDVTLRIDSAQLGDTGDAEIGGLQYLINREVVSPLVEAGASGDFEYVWDSTGHGDGTYALGVRFVSGTAIHGFASGVAWLAVDNVAGAVEGEQEIPIAAYHSRKPEGGILPGIDVVDFAGFPVQRNADPYPYAYAPPAHQSADPAAYRDSEVWFLETSTHAASDNDGQNASFYQSVDGHIFTDVSYTLVGPSSEGVVDRERRVDYVDGYRNSATTSGFSTYVPNPEGPGWVGVDVAGRIFRVDLDGTVTTLVGRRIKDGVVPYSTEIGPSIEEFEAHQFEYVGDFEDDLYFNTPNDLYFDPADSKILYVADTHNHRIAKVDFHHDVPRITTFAGMAGVSGYADGSLADSRFSAPYSLVTDWRNGDIYVADRDNHAIRKITPDGVVSTVVGRGPDIQTLPTSEQDAHDRRDNLTQDADFDAANISYPQVVRLDSSGNIIVGEHTTHAVRRVNMGSEDVEYVFNIPITFTSTWIWLDVDWRGNVGPVDDIIVTAAQTKRESGNFNNLVWRIGPDGTKYGSIAPLTVTAHYPWAIAIDDAEARFVNTGAGGNGIRSVVADLDRERPEIWFDAWSRGGDTFEAGTTFDVPKVFDGQPSFRGLFGNRARGFSRLGTLPVFDDLDRMTDEELGDYIRSGFGGAVPRPDLTGHDLAQLIYYIRAEALGGAFTEPDRPAPPTDTTAPGISNIRAEQVGPDRVRLTRYTDEAAIGVAAHGVLPGIYHESSPLTDGFDDGQHSLIVDGLSATQVNYVRLHIKDIAGNITISDEFTISLDSSGAGNSPPEAIPQAASVLKNTPRAVRLRGSDVNGDDLTFTLVSQPDHGTITGFDASDGTLTFTPDTDYLGEDSFQFKVNDGEFDSSAATVRITVVVDAPPEVTSFTNDALDRDEDEPGIQAFPGDTIVFAAEARDPEGKQLDWDWQYTKDNGQVTTRESGVGDIPDDAFKYPGNSAGSVFTHIIRVSDGLGTDQQVVTVEVIDRPAPGIIGHWTLNDGSGQTAQDATDNGNDGTLNATSQWTSGPLGGAVELVGSDVLNLQNPSDFRFNHLDPFTMALWFRRSSDAAVNGRLIDKNSGEGRHIRVHYNNYGRVTIEMASGWTTALKATVETNIDFNAWHHFALVYDGSAEADGIAFYIDGVRQDFTVDQDNLDGTFDNVGDLEVGSTGSIDDVRIYNFDVDGTTVRSMMGGTGSAILQDDGTLRIDAGDEDDYIRVDKTTTSLKVKINGADLGVFDLADVERVHAYGNDGNDIIRYRGPNTIPAMLSGGAGDDLLIGAGGPDELIGGDGEDTLNAGSGNDTLRGGKRDDVLRGASGKDVLEGGDGDDWIDGDKGADTLHGGLGDDTLKGENGTDTIFGGEGNDQLLAGGGNDYLEAGPGDDLLVGGADNDTLDGGDGADLLSGGKGSDTILGGAGRDTLLGENGNDDLSGGDDSDLLLGGGGNDVINGDGARDLAIGQDGADQLFGGDDDDLLVGGMTDYGNDLGTLDLILDQWTEGAGYGKRTKRIRLALNGSPKLAASKITDDGDTDTLSGGAGRDWFFADQNTLDVLLDKLSTETDELFDYPND